MADTKLYKSVSVPMHVYKMLNFLRRGKITKDKDLSLTVSKTIELLTIKSAKSKGYKYQSK